MQRRSYLGIFCIASLSGCSTTLDQIANSEKNQTQANYPYIDDLRVYMAEDLDRLFSYEWKKTGSPHESELLLIPSSTERSAAEIVQWLQNEKIVGIIGSPAESLLNDLRDEVGDVAYGDSQEEVDIVVTHLDESDLSSYYFISPGNGLESASILSFLDESIEQIKKSS